MTCRQAEEFPRWVTVYGRDWLFVGHMWRAPCEECGLDGFTGLYGGAHVRLCLDCAKRCEKRVFEGVSV